MLLRFHLNLKLICPELSDLICVSSHQNDGLPASDIFNLLQYCAHFVSSIHENDIDADIRLSIDDSYNPPKYGRAYYFTKHGSQLRKMQSFPVDDGSQEKVNFDNVPEEFCKKKFPQVSKKGILSVFLVLPTTWSLLWVPYNTWIVRAKRSSCIFVYPCCNCTNHHFL